MTSDNRPICEVLGEGHLGELADKMIDVFLGRKLGVSHLSYDVVL